MGTPIGGGTGPPSSTGVVVTPTVHWAGPYRLTRVNGRPGGTPRCSAEPPVCIIRSTVWDGQGSASTASASGVGRNAAEICSSASQTARSGGEARTSAGGTTSVPPAARVGQVSQTATSNPGLHSSVVRSWRPSGYATLRHRIRFARLPWLTPTPLGRPVEPDV